MHPCRDGRVTCLKRPRNREGALPPQPSFPCMNQEGNNVSFGTLRLLNIFPQHNSIIQDKLEQNPCRNGIMIGSANVNRTVVTTA